MKEKMDKCTVVVDDWEMKCCGSPFKVGDTVKWYVSKWENYEKLLVDVGNIDFRYNDHMKDSDIVFEIEGNVVNIFAIHYAYTSKHELEQYRGVAIPISGILVKIEKSYGWDENADRWEDEGIDGWENKDIAYKKLYCYYVCLDNVNITTFIPK
jgi:hypothetical protein